jgi:hypothetical protein
MTGISHQGCNFYFIIDILYLMRPDIKPFFHSLGMVSISSLRTLHLLWGIWLLSLTSGPLQKHFVLAAFFLCISHSPDSCVCVCVCVCVSILLLLLKIGHFRYCIAAVLHTDSVYSQGVDVFVVCLVIYLFG